MNVYERIWKLQTMIGKIIMDGARDPEKVADALQKVTDVLQAIIDEPVKVLCQDYFQLLNVEKLGATDGTETYDTAKEVFKAGFDADFKNWGIVFSGVALEMDIAVDELIKDGKFKDFLGNTQDELERRRMLGSQFAKFCREHPGKLSKKGATFAVLTENDEPVVTDLSNVFVAYASVGGGGRLGAFVRRFDFDYAWDAEYRPRVLYPQR